jgi:hypothetical protein
MLPAYPSGSFKKIFAELGIAAVNESNKLFFGQYMLPFQFVD